MRYSEISVRTNAQIASGGRPREEGVVQREEDVADDPNAVAARPLRNKDRGDWNPAECVDVCLCHVKD